MQRIWLILFLLLGLMGLVGCDKPAPAPVQPKPVAVDDLLPTRAQPKLPTLKIFLGAEALDAELAHTREQVMAGMMFRTNVAETDAMLFILPVPQRTSFWMKNCPESLSAAYIDPAGVIAEIVKLEANNTNAVVAASDNIQYVLEVKEGWFARHGIAPGAVIRTDRGSLAETFFRR